MPLVVFPPLGPYPLASTGSLSLRFLIHSRPRRETWGRGWGWDGRRLLQACLPAFTPIPPPPPRPPSVRRRVAGTAAAAAACRSACLGASRDGTATAPALARSPRALARSPRARLRGHRPHVCPRHRDRAALRDTATEPPSATPRARLRGHRPPVRPRQHRSAWARRASVRSPARSS